MKKIKEFWRKLKYWQKGIIVGYIFGLISMTMTLYLHLIIPNIPDSIYKYSFFLFFFADDIIRRILFLLNFNLDKATYIKVVMYFGSVVGIIFYILIGALIGLIIGKIKKK